MEQPLISILIPGDEYWHDGSVPFHPRYVRVVKNSQLNDFFDKNQRRDFEAKYGQVNEKNRQKLFFLLRLGSAISKKNEAAIYDAVESYLESFLVVNDYKGAKNFYYQLSCWLHEIKLRPMYVLNQEINNWIKKARYVVWWSKREEKLKTGLYCEDIITALFALWISRLNEARGVSICLKCSNPFKRTRTNQKYCSPRCQNNANVARHRKNKSSKLR